MLNSYPKPPFNTENDVTFSSMGTFLWRFTPKIGERVNPSVLRPFELWHFSTKIGLAPAYCKRGGHSNPTCTQWRKAFPRDFSPRQPKNYGTIGKSLLREPFPREIFPKTFSINVNGDGLLRCPVLFTYTHL